MLKQGSTKNEIKTVSLKLWPCSFFVFRFAIKFFKWYNEKYPLIIFILGHSRGDRCFILWFFIFTLLRKGGPWKKLNFVWSQISNSSKMNRHKLNAYLNLITEFQSFSINKQLNIKLQTQLIYCDTPVIWKLKVVWS